MEGVEVRACCGEGTLLCTGKTTSGSDGEYRLSFGPGVLFYPDGKWGVGTQAATISAGREGFFEKNLGRQGDLMMSDEQSPPRRKRTVYPNRPYQVDFVMLPAATVEGQLLSAKGEPMGHQVLDLSGKQLPPSSSVLAEVQTDRDGRFRFTSIPTGNVLWFVISRPGRRRDLTSGEVHLEKPTTYQFKVAQTRAADGRESLAITSMPE